MAFKASMTVEAAFVLPLFIFFFVNVMALFNITEIQSEIEGALHQAGSELSLMAFDLKFAESAVSGDDNVSAGRHCLICCSCMGDTRSTCDTAAVQCLYSCHRQQSR